MPVLPDLDTRISRILAPVVTLDGQVVPHPQTTPADSKRYVSLINNIKKSLQLIKSEVLAEQKQVSANYGDLARKVNPDPFLGVFVGRGVAKHVAANTKHKLKGKKDDHLDIYHQATRRIDQHIAFLDSLKLSVQQAQIAPAQEGPLFAYTCQYCGHQFQTPGGLVHCPQCGR